MTFKILPKLLFACVVFTVTSCKDENEDVTNAVNKNGSIETSVQVTHLDSTHDILTTTHQVWTRQQLVKTVEYRDTLPALGIVNTTAENDEGDTKTVAVPKDYEIFITVK
jgi:hypothetical protein